MKLVQSIKTKTNTSFAEPLCGILYLLSLHNKEKNYFYLEKIFSDTFENTGYYEIYNIENNLKHKSLKKIYQTLNISYPKDNEIEKYINEITKGNDGLIDFKTKYMLHDNYFEKNKIVYEEKNDVSNKLILKNPIKLDEEKLHSFDDSHHFFHIPSHTLENNYDIKALDAFIRSVYENTPYQNLILLTANNAHKKYCKEKFNIKTTHYYDEMHTSGVSHEKTYNSFTSKTKGNLYSLIKDLLYVQEAKAKYISLHHLTTNKKILNNPIFLKQSIKEKIYVRKAPAAFDVNSMLVKENKLFKYEK